MPEKEKTPELKYKDYEQAEAYIEAVREIYRDGKAHYQGRRDQDLKDINWFASDTASEIVDTAYLGMMALGSVDATRAIEDEDREVMGGFSWAEYREEFENLLGNFAIITHKINDKGLNPDIPSFINLNPGDQLQVGLALFADFQDHNARRFGAQTAGVRRTKRKTIYPEDGGAPKIAKIEYDPDKASSLGEIEENMRNRGYRLKTGVIDSVHQAGKISVGEYDALRGGYHNEDGDLFNRNVSQYRDVRKHYEEETNL